LTFAEALGIIDKRCSLIARTVSFHRRRQGKGVLRLPKKPKLDEEREELTKILAGELPLLRAALRLKQTEMAATIGISRLNYQFVEGQKNPMPWNTFVPLFLYFETKEPSKRILRSLGDFEERARHAINVQTPPLDEETEESIPAAVCLYCGYRNVEGSKFCGECGTRIGEAGKRCAACGAEAKSGARYCTDCGVKIY
jgi:DNA-binding XRE family transcriptional regulator